MLSVNFQVVEKPNDIGLQFVKTSLKGALKRESLSREALALGNGGVPESLVDKPGIFKAREGKTHFPSSGKIVVNRHLDGKSLSQKTFCGVPVDQIGTCVGLLCQINHQGLLIGESVKGQGHSAMMVLKIDDVPQGRIFDNVL